MDQKSPLRQLIARRQFMQSAVAAGFGTVAGRSAVGSAAAKRGKTDEDDGQVPTLSITDRLEDRRYVVAGIRAYVVGMENGRFPAMG